MKHITITLTEDQYRELKDIVRDTRVARAQYMIESPNFDKFDPYLAYLKRLETTLAKAKS